jgi:regulator of replication initiation timing
MTLEATLLLAVAGPLMTVAAVGYRLGVKLNSLTTSLTQMKRELENVSKDNLRLAAEVKALRELIGALLNK